MKRVALSLSVLLVLCSMAWGQGQLIQSHPTVVGGINACTATGSSNAFTCQLPYPLPAYVTRQCFTMLANHTITGPATINVDGQGARTIKKVVAGTVVDLAADDIGAGQFVLLCYDGTVMQAVALGGGTSGEGTSLTFAEGLVQEGSAVRTASQEPGFLAPGTSDLTAGGGEGGKMQTRTDGSLEYTDNATPAVRHRGLLLPSPFTFNLGTGSGCKTDPNGGALTINASDEVVCKSDIVGEGGAGSGDLTAFGSCTTGDCATTGFPLTSYWMGGSAVPSPPAANQGRVFFDQTAKNLAVIADDGSLMYGAQVMPSTEHFFLTSFAADGTFTAARPSLATLSDNASVARLTGPQSLTQTQVVPRTCQLGATSGNLTPNLDLCDVVYRYDVAGALTFQAPTATGMNPRHEQSLTFDLCAASAQSLTWDTAYAGNYGLALPSTLPAGCRAIAFRYSTNSAKYELWSVHESNPLLQTLRLQGTESGVITFQPQANAGTYNWNPPITAGTAGQVLTSGGGGGAPMTWTTPTAGGTGTIHLFVGSPMLPTSNAALVSGSGNYYKLIFDDTTSWCAWWQVSLPTDYASGLRFEGTYTPAGSTTGTLNLDVSVMAVSAGDAVALETDSYATANACNDTAIPTTADFPDRVGCNLTNDDGAVAEDTLRVKVCRNMADTAATQIRLVDAVLQYTKQ